MCSWCYFFELNYFTKHYYSFSFNNKFTLLFKGNIFECLNMSRHHSRPTPKRYFINKLADYQGSIEFNKDLIMSHCYGYAKHIFMHQKISHNECDGGLYVGLAGLTYMCYYLSQDPNFERHKEELLSNGEKYLNQALSYCELSRVKEGKAMEASFILGSAGTYAIAAVFNHIIGNQEKQNDFLHRYAALADVCEKENFTNCGSDELFVGRAGYLCGILFLEKALQVQVLPQTKIDTICQTIVKTGISYAERHKSHSPLMYSYYDVEYLGAAHGLSSILQMLLNFPKFLDANPALEAKIKGAVDFMLQLQTSSGNFPPTTMEAGRISDDDELVHWCHGAPGVIYLMAKAFLRWKDDKYLKSCLLCGEIIWQKGLLRKGPGICHGVAGNGYAFLLLYRLTNDEKHYHRAIQFANFLFAPEFKSARIPDRPLSLYEGLAGSACFLADLLHPNKAEFPLFDVF